MIRISTKGRYALRALVDLAELTSEGRVSVPLKEIAKRQSISTKYLEALFNILKSAGIIKSLRGAKGGYTLGRRADQITAMEVIESIEGPVAFVDCCTEDAVCERTPTCKTIHLWKAINDSILDKLKSHTLQSLI